MFLEVAVFFIKPKIKVTKLFWGSKILSLLSWKTNLIWTNAQKNCSEMRNHFWNSPSLNEENCAQKYQGECSSTGTNAFET